MAVEPYSLEQAELDIAFLIGKVDRLDEVLTKNDSTDAPNTPAAGLIHYSFAGQHKYASPDGGFYNTGRSSAAMKGAVTISATGFATVAGGGVSLSLAVAAGQYAFRAHLMHIDNGAGAAAVALYQMVSPAFSSGSAQLTGSANGPLVSVRFDNASGFGTALAAPTVTPASNVRHNVVIEGSAVFTATGTLAVQAAINAVGAAQFVIAAGSRLELFPVT